MNSQSGATWLGFPVDDAFTFVNVAYLVCLIAAAAASVALWQVSTASQKDKDDQIVAYQKQADLQIAEAKNGAAKANARASALELEAEQARLATVRLQAANLELERAVSPRLLEQQKSAVPLQPFANMPFRVLSNGELEPRQTAGQIRFLLAVQSHWADHLAFNLDHPGRFDGVVVHEVNGLAGSNVQAAVQALILALNQSGIVARNGFPISGDVPGVLVEVGPKPLPRSMQDDVGQGQSAWGNFLEEASPNP